jgi:PIN domain nuclease of toxin-antitoxin system
MKILLDTHALLWWLFDDPKLSETAYAVIAEVGNTILVSSASAWEIATKHRLGKMPEAGDVAENLPEYLSRTQFSVLEITLPHALAAGRLPGSHKDPFDRMLIAQARLENLPIITKDPAFKDYGINLLW